MIDVMGNGNGDDAGDMAVMTAMGTTSATATLDGDGGPTKKPKSVTFSSSCKTKLVPHYKDYTKRQWNQIWYTQEEIDTMNILSEKERRAEKKKQPLPFLWLVHIRPFGLLLPKVVIVACCCHNIARPASLFPLSLQQLNNCTV